MRMVEHKDGRSKNTHNKGKMRSSRASKRERDRAILNQEGKDRRLGTPVTSQRSTFLSNMAETRRIWPVTRFSSNRRHYHSLSTHSDGVTLLLHLHGRNSPAPSNHHQVEKHKVFPSAGGAEFVGVYITKDGNSPAQSNSMKHCKD